MNSIILCMHNIILKQGECFIDEGLREFHGFLQKYLL